ncbi:ATP-binding protein [Nonomuraea jiangxiensis]|uniref:AAA ATPase domain-containing protein n=1 Tax=Nonomuraea jiangxiensis TaxID=633440 RepID=A0A1G8T4W7_9ACTN|nr:AAA family ATPase [Nonomuraea jiangxiensis]SDJ36015.1 AAA ATPase domain-containing protein [Nonomuraea jiangxiensis]
MPIDVSAHELIGREHPAALLRAEITRLIGSHGGLVLVTGEAGIGKTTLVTSAAGEARRAGVLVVGGACWDSGSAPGYWPWVQVLRALRRAVEPEEWAAAEEAAGGGLTALAALLGEAQGGEPRSGETRGGETRSGEAAGGFRVYDAVTSALVSLSQRRPVLVVIDDLHVADPDSLRLLEFAARQTWFERLLLVGTYRDAEVEPVDHPLRDLLSPLVAKATTITLNGLDRAGVAALMARTAGQEPPPDLVAEVHLRTGGNPFFVEQTARLWRSGGSADAVAPGVRDALLRRLSLLPRQVSELLPAAAVLGNEFHRQVLAEMIAAPVAHVDRLLELAVVAKLVVARGGGVFAFAHDLVRETLYDSLDDPRELHGAVVSAFDRSPGLAGKVLPNDLAGHAYLAGDRADPERAVALLLAAAHEARCRLAGEEQLLHLRRAHELSSAVSPRRRALIGLDLGQELHHYPDRRDEVRRLFDEAAAIARDLHDPELPARVALVFHTHYGLDKARDLLREAHRRLVGQDVPDEQMPLDLVFHLMARARKGGDDDALTFSLWVQHDIIWGPGTAPERVALIDELIAVARRTADRDLEHFATALRWVAMVEQGDPGYIDEFHDYAAKGWRSERVHLILATDVDASIVAAFAGRFAEAEERLSGVRPETVHEHFGFMLEHHRWAMALLRGKSAEQRAVLRGLRGTHHPCVPLLEALTALQGGDLNPALRHLHAGQPDDRVVQPLWLRFQAELAAATRDPELCARARAALAPHRGQWLVSLYGWEISGPYDLWLGLVDAAEGRWEEAVEELTAAYRSADLMQSRPWSVLARAHLAETLLARAWPGDADAASELLTGVRREAAELGMHHVQEQAELGLHRLRESAERGMDHLGEQGELGAHRLRESAELGTQRLQESAGPVGTGPSGDRASGTSGDGRGRADGGSSGVGEAEFRRDGAVWSLAFAGRLVHMPDAKGLRDLHILLSRPGGDVSAVSLLAPEGGEVVVAARRMGGDDVLDEEAKSRYRRRLARLDEEIDRAAELGDDRRAAEFDRERAALLEELRAAAGLGGRTRRLGDEAERARKTVTARIRDVLRKLDSTHPELAAHLRATVSTGATCRYQPDTPITWRL